MSEGNKDALQKVQGYRKLVLLYEALDEEIDKLIMAHDGSMENMSPEDLTQYRELARKRAEVLNDMRLLEQELSIDND